MPKEGDALENDKVKYWLKISARFSAWALLAAVIVLLFTGWGITQTGVIFKFTFGLIDRRAADMIHRATNGPLAFFFLTHVMANIRLAVSSRRRYLIWLISGILITVGIGLMVIVVYLEYFRTGG